MSTELAALAARVAQLERLMARSSRSASLAYSSIEAGAIEVHDEAGQLTAIVGVQADGTSGVVAVNAPPPPTPGAPTVMPVPGGVAVQWDGVFADAPAAPLDYSRTEVHVGEILDFTPSAKTLRTTIESPRGGTVELAAGTAVYVRLIARNTSGKAGTPSMTAGPVSPGVVIAEGVVDGIVIQTAASGRRIVLNPLSTSPALEIYSGAPAETRPGGLSSDVIDMGTWRQPEVSVQSPSVGGPVAGLRLRSPVPSGRGQGRVSLEPSSQSDGYAHLGIVNGGSQADSEITIYGARAAALGGGYHSQIVRGAGITWYSGNRQMTLSGGVLDAPNIASGSALVRPTAGVPTSVTVTGLNVSGSQHAAFVTANSTVPGTTMLGVAASGVSSAGLTLWITRTAATQTTLWWMVVGS